MGLFKGSKNKKEKEQEPASPGWEAIEEAIKKQYNGAPKQLEHFGTLISWALGGKDPLDGISILDGGDYYHFVTFGLSELYEKETDDPEYSGYGFELTVKLKKSGVKEEDEEFACMAGILQAIARITFNRGDIFCPDEYIYTGQTAGMDRRQKSGITGFITKEDEMGTIDTPNGKVQFVQLIGATDAELKMLVDKKMTVPELAAKIGTDLTDYDRESVV